MVTTVLLQMFLVSDPSPRSAPWLEREPLVYNRQVSAKKRGPTVWPPLELDIDPVSGNIVKKGGL